MTFWLLIGAAGISFFAMCFHGVLGRRMYLGNINAAEMQGRTKSLSAVSWDVFTGQLFVTGATLLYVAYTPAAALMLYPIIAVNIVGALIFQVAVCSRAKGFFYLARGLFAGCDCRTGLGDAIVATVLASLIWDFG